MNAIIDTIPARVRAAIADIAAGRQPNAATARSKAAAPYITERSSGMLTRRSHVPSVYRLTKTGRAVADAMANG